MNGKRPAEDIGSSSKRTKMKLVAGSSERTNESDSESVHSNQGYRTELAQDTSDSSSSPALNPHQVEYEVAEPEKNKNINNFISSDDSLDEEELQDFSFDLNSSESIDNGLLGDSSEENSTSPTSNSDVDPGLPRSDYLDFEKCALCDTKHKDISYPYCSACFTWKKNFFPDRPNPKKKFLKKSRRQSCASSGNDINSDFQNSESNNSLPNDNSKNSNFQNSKSSNSLPNVNSNNNDTQGCLDDSGMGTADASQTEDTVDGPSQASTSSQASCSSQASSSTLILPSSSRSSSSSASNSTLEQNNPTICSVCFLNPENGLFVHSTLAHRYGCYSCAKEIWRRSSCCPICRRKVFKVTKLFF